MSDQEWTDEMLRLIEFADKLRSTLQGTTREYIKAKMRLSVDALCKDGSTTRADIYQYLGMLGLTLPDTGPAPRRVRVMPLP